MTNSPHSDIDIINVAPAHVIVLNAAWDEIERHEFDNKAQAELFQAELRLPEGYSTVLGVDVLSALEGSGVPRQTDR